MTLALAACGGDESGNRVAALDDSASADNADDADDEDDGDDADPAAPTTRPVVDPVSFKALLPLLPAAPSGWTADAPDGSTTSLPDYKVTFVNGTYRRAGAGDAPDASVTIQITDGGFAESIAMPFKMMSMMSHESTDGYQKGVAIGDNPAYETWNNSSRSAELHMLVGDRFLVYLSGSQLDPAELRGFAESIDLSALAGLAD